MVTEHEELWEKELNPIVEKLLSEGKDVLEYDKLSKIVHKKRDKTRVVTFKATKGSAV